jgi:hypothetical protein
MHKYHRLFLMIMLLLSMWMAHAYLHAQCSMCRDSTAGSLPPMRAGLRRAIPVLGIPAVVIFSGIFWLAFRLNRSEEE